MDVPETLIQAVVILLMTLCAVSLELRVSGCYGLFDPGDKPSQVALATLDWRTTLAVELAYLRDLDEKRGMAIQVGTIHFSFLLKYYNKTHTHTHWL